MSNLRWFKLDTFRWVALTIIVAFITKGTEIVFFPYDTLTQNQIQNLSIGSVLVLVLIIVLEIYLKWSQAITLEQEYTHQKKISARLLKTIANNLQETEGYLNSKLHNCVKRNLYGNEVGEFFIKNNEQLEKDKRSLRNHVTKFDKLSFDKDNMTDSLESIKEFETRLDDFNKTQISNSDDFLDLKSKILHAELKNSDYSHLSDEDKGEYNNQIKPELDKPEAGLLN